MTARKFSRSMEEAFGPGHRGNLHVEPEPMHPAVKIIVAIFCVVVLVAVALMLTAS